MRKRIKGTWPDAGTPASAILTADLHLSETVPISRTDNYIAAQAGKLKFLQDLSQSNNGCPILCAGDVCNSWKATPWFCGWAYRNLPSPLITIPGNHDLPQHSLELYDKSTLALLETVYDKKRFHVLRGNEISVNNLSVTGLPFGIWRDFTVQEKDIKGFGNRRRILMLHELVWPPDSTPPPGAGGVSGDKILDQFAPYFDLILTGDNHEGFITQRGNTWLVNPGSMLRISADKVDYQPQCYLYYAAENEVVPVKYPIELNVHSREHIDVKRERDGRIAAYIERMKQDWEIGLSYRRNLQAFFDENDTRRKIRDIIWEHVGC